MLEIIQNSLKDKSGALIVILSVMIMAIGGSYKLLRDDLEKTNSNVSEIEKYSHKLSERLHELDKKIIRLEAKNDD